MARVRGCTCTWKSTEPCEACWRRIERAELERDDPPDDWERGQDLFERELDRRFEG